MVRIYNATEDTYETIAEYIAAYDADDTDVFYVQFLYKLTSLFDLAKKRTAMRGRRAKDANGNSLFDAYAMTVDEEDFFDTKLEVGSGELFRKLTAWTKNVYKSYQYKVDHAFGDAADYNSDVNDFYSNPGGDDIITDYDALFVTDELIGNLFQITSGSHKDEIYIITDNTTQFIHINGNVGSDITGETFTILAPGIEEPSLQYFITLPDTLYLDLLESVEAKLDEALVLYTIKEWYRINRFMEDYQIENARYDELAKEVKSLLMQKTEPTRRKGFFRDY